MFGLSEPSIIREIGRFLLDSFLNISDYCLWIFLTYSKSFPKLWWKIYGMWEIWTNMTKTLHKKFSWVSQKQTVGELLLLLQHLGRFSFKFQKTSDNHAMLLDLLRNCNNIIVSPKKQKTKQKIKKVYNC